MPKKLNPIAAAIVFCFSASEGFMIYQTATTNDFSPSTADWMVAIFLMGPLLFAYLGIVVGIIMAAIAAVVYWR